MKKNGFISISVIYSFFLIFMLLLVLIISSYVNNRYSLDIYKNDIKEFINNKYYLYSSNKRKVSDVILGSIVSDTGSDGVYKETYSSGSSTINHYHYEGSAPDNYICLEKQEVSTANIEKCDIKNLFRIVGLYNVNYKATSTSGVTNQMLVKLVGVSSLGNKKFGSTTWNNTEIKTYLNTTYYNSLTTYQKKLIANVNWPYVRYSGSDYTNLTAYSAYTLENSYSPSSGSNVSVVTSDLNYVGLLSLSDYGYASRVTSKCTRDTKLMNYSNSTVDCAANSWLLYEEWLMASVGPSDNGVFKTSTGSIAYTDIINSKIIRPSVFLNPNTYIVSGSGKADDPYRLFVS